MRSILQVFRNGLLKTKTSLVRRIQGIFTDATTWDEDCYEELEAALISTDLGVDVSTRIVDEIRGRYERGEVLTTEDIMGVAREDISGLLSRNERKAEIRYAEDGPTVVLLVGVNGSGKTTTCAKLAHLWKEDGRSVLMAACDTFRAAAVEQLNIWGGRLDVPVIAGQQGGDAAAVAFDATRSAVQRRADILLIDTAGRQHTRRSLMDELVKIRRTVGKACPGAPHEVWLTVDASSGTNALIQAREFGRHCDVTGLVLTKLDGTGKGGVVVAIHEELGYPVHFIGLGEEMGDLQPFDVTMFAQALFE
ncbi:MAG: signal recognition particle-docking protein FtsY [Lentisphaerae bacterium]|nr:signal recognition particle-docking protein FtsY [Lentisphaerota bacterium]MBT4820588.1 signal recognition particle-docking protein FtsY [Lentisphaerota bacterium]MBT5611479.1 signal recognition particle-docking protein FtsY [Lentisphaerota bacterium]MBT7056341.1 signal recognition particle-docking protein FtsY [Lentisphaerota bacterium]MBT7842983.1 signal recognition particle-docking protein FtsY [Lentisphaerota bacterium]